MAKTCLHIMLSDGGEYVVVVPATAKTICLMHFHSHFTCYVCLFILCTFLLLYSLLSFIFISQKAKYKIKNKYKKKHHQPNSKVKSSKTTCSSHVPYRIAKSHESHWSVCFSNMLFLMFSTEKLWALNLCKLKFVNLWKFVYLRICFSASRMESWVLWKHNIKFVGFKISLTFIYGNLWKLHQKFGINWIFVMYSVSLIFLD